MEKLASYLDEHPTVEQEFKKDGYSTDQIELLKRKGVYPYDFTSSFESLNVTHLPSKDEFYSCLNEEGISDDDYAHAQLVWSTLNIRDIGHYSDVYLKCDVLLLSEVFEDFREKCLKSHKIDAAQHITLAGFTFDAAFLFSDVKLELLTDVDMLLMVEKGIDYLCSHHILRIPSYFMFCIL